MNPEGSYLAKFNPQQSLIPFAYGKKQVVVLQNISSSSDKLLLPANGTLITGYECIDRLPLSAVFAARSLTYRLFQTVRQR